MRPWQVRDVMTADVLAVTEDAPYREVVEAVIGRRVSAVPVLDDDRRVCGVVSEADLLRKVELYGEPHERRIFQRRGMRTARSKAEAVYARKLMTTPAVTTTPDASVVAAAKTMDRYHVKRLPVVDDLGRLVGIVTRGDLLKVHLRPDADIRRDVVEEVLWRVLAVREDIIRVSVTDGVVELAGQLDRRTAVEIAEHLASQVSGVVQVVNRLGFDYDDTFLAGLAQPSGHPGEPL